MYFGLSEDQMFFQDSIKKYLEEQASIEIVKKMDTVILNFLVQVLKEFLMR